MNSCEKANIFMENYLDHATIKSKRRPAEFLIQIINSVGPPLNIYVPAIHWLHIGCSERSFQGNFNDFRVNNINRLWIG